MSQIKMYFVLLTCAVGIPVCFASRDSCWGCVNDGGSFVTFMDGRSMCVKDARFYQEGKLMSFVTKREDCEKEENGGGRRKEANPTEGNITLTFYITFGGGIVVSGGTVAVCSILLRRWLKKWFLRLINREAESAVEDFHSCSSVPVISENETV